MAELKVIVRTADQARKAEIALTDINTGKDVIDAAVNNWSLAVDTDYSLVNVTKGKAIIPSDTLSKAGVETNDTLEIQPVLAAGATK